VPSIIIDRKQEYKEERSGNANIIYLAMPVRRIGDFGRMLVFYIRVLHRIE